MRFLFAEIESLLGYDLSTGTHSMIQLELHLVVYNQLGPATIKTPMPMPNVPVRRELLQPYRYVKGSNSSTVKGYASWKPLSRSGRRTKREPNILTVVVDDSAVPENLLA